MNQLPKLTEQQFKLLMLVKSKPGMNLTEILDEIADIYEEFPDGGAVKAKLHILEEKRLIVSRLIPLRKGQTTRRYYSAIP